MIEINLLPEELKAKLIKSSAVAQKYVYVVYVIAFLIIIALSFNVFFLVGGYMAKSKVKTLEREWGKISPQRNNLDSLRRHTQGLSEEARVMQDLLIQRINWSQKLSSLSSNLVGGIWFRELTLNNKDFIIQGSAISLQKEELRLINQFIGNLKKDSEFFRNFKSLDESSVTREKIGSAEVMDFVLTGKLN